MKLHKHRSILYQTLEFRIIDINALPPLIRRHSRHPIFIFFPLPILPRRFIDEFKFRDRLPMSGLVCPLPLPVSLEIRARRGRMVIDLFLSLIVDSFDVLAGMGGEVFMEIVV